MKTLLLIGILLSFMIKIEASPYYPIAEQNKIWNKCTDIYPMNSHVHLEFLYRTDSIVSHDSLISSVIMVKSMEYQEWTLAGVLKEDTINKKVYFNNNLVFDFNLDVGDTVFFGFNDTMYYTCTNSDSVMIDSAFRKRLFISSNNTSYFVSSYGVWIEGIGDENRGICNVGFNGGGFLGAVYKDDQEIFYARECNGITSVEEFLTEKFLLYPNPAENQIEISTSPNSILKPKAPIEFRLYDMAGKIIATYDLISEKTLLPIHQFPSNIYYWHILAENKLLQTGKLVTQ
jgi:hypothetical protein